MEEPCARHLVIGGHQGHGRVAYWLKDPVLSPDRTMVKDTSRMARTQEEQVIAENTGEAVYNFITQGYWRSRGTATS